MQRVATYVGIVSVVVIAVVSFIDIDLAVRIGVNAIIGSLIIGIIVYISKVFSR